MIRHRMFGLAGGMIAALVAGQVRAADVPAASVYSEAQAPAALSPWQIRIRALGIITNDEGKVDAIGGSDLSYTDTVIPELDITYYFTDNIAAELILGTTYANIYGEGTIDGLDKIGKTWLLPPTLTLQYHFTNFGAFKPYIGAGVNYTIFYNQKDGSGTDLDIEDTFGAALQFGFDYWLTAHVGLNFDVKKLYLRPDFDVTVGGTRYSGEAELDPWLVGAGLTYRF